MAVLSRPDLLRYIDGRRIRFDPPIRLECIAQVSVDLRLGRKFTWFRAPPGYLPAIHVDPPVWTSADLWEHKEQATYRLEPGQFVLALTLERVYIPHDLVAIVEGRSTYARIGVTVHVTAPKIDPGFDASITLEMANFGKVAVELRAEIDMPAQLLFFQLSTPIAKTELYGSREGDRFKSQTDPIPRGPSN